VYFFIVAPVVGILTKIMKKMQKMYKKRLHWRAIFGKMLQGAAICA
jgi:hypothetical protein